MRRSKTQLKQAAQDDLLYYAASAFYAAADNAETRDDPEYAAELRRQFERIEKLFGYVPGSTNHS